jgi:hypothetical protein
MVRAHDQVNIKLFSLPGIVVAYRAVATEWVLAG